MCPLLKNTGCGTADCTEWDASCTPIGLGEAEAGKTLKPTASKLPNRAAEKRTLRRENPIEDMTKLQKKEMPQLYFMRMILVVNGNFIFSNIFIIP